MEGQQQQDTNMQNMLMELLKGQQEQFKLQEERMRQMDLQMKLLMENKTNPDTGSSAASISISSTRLLNDLSGRLSTFVFDCENNQTFSRWFDRFGDVFTIDGALLDDKAKVRLLVGKLSNEVFDRYTNQILPKTTTDIDFADTVRILKEMFDPKISLFTSRYQCLKLEKKESEDYMEYTGRVNEQCEKANFQDLDNEGLKALLWVYGLKSSRDADLRQRLLLYLDRMNADKKTVTIHDMYKECDMWLNIKREAKLVETGSREVNEVKTQSRPPRNREAVKSECWNCGNAGHRSNTCQKSKWTCKKCKSKGHKEQYCDKIAAFKNGRTPSKPRRQNNQLVIIGKTEVSSADVQAVRKYMEVKINGYPVEFQLDTGSDITLMNVDAWKRMGEPKLEAADITVCSASGNRMEIVGKLKCDFEIGGLTGSGHAYISAGASLFGLDWIQKNESMTHHLEMMIVSKVDKTDSSLVEELKTRFSSVFEEGLGRCTKEKAVLKLLPDATPTFRAKRPVPHAAAETVDRELDRLIGMDVIEAVNHSDWAAPIVTVKKANGKIRVCADFSTGLNKALEDCEYPLPIPEDIFASLNGGTVFSQIDFSDAYLQVELSEESKPLVVVNTHRGLFRYKRLPFGIKTAPAIFQQLMNKMCSGLRGVTSYLDDVIVVGKTMEEHKSNLVALFERVEEYGFRVRYEKCSFAKSEIPFLGFIVDRNGRRPNPDEIQVIKNMEAPKTESQLRAFLGMITYYGNFVPQMKSLRGPLDQLMIKDVKWKWEKEQQEAFMKLKAVLSSDMNLTHYDPQQEIVVAADACEYGIGAVISHRFKDGSEKPICHAARSLTAAEKNYSQIEKEGLGLIFAVKKFHKYVFGRKFRLLTDHKPLLAIFGSKKGVPVHSANRLMRWATILIGYDFVIEYINTNDFGQADGLSRMIQRYPMTEEDTVVASVERDVQAMYSDHIRKLPVTSEDVRVSTLRDPVLRKVIKAVKQNKWPETTSTELQQYKLWNTTLSVVQDCLMAEDRVVVPTELRTRVLKELHIGHPGISRMKSLARSLVYWPDLTTDIEEIVKKCGDCQMHGKSLNKVPLQTWPAPERVWQRIHIDFAGPMDGVFYFVVVDALSKWPEIFIMKNITARITVEQLTSLFARFGMPETIVSDNGTQFTSEEFKVMCKANGIVHARTAPYHPQSNGQAERFVDTLKRTLRKLKGEGVATESMLNTFLLSYRSTPSRLLEDRSPAEVFLGRKLRTPLTLLIPRAVEQPARTDTQIDMERQFDRKNGAKMRTFKEGESVMVKVYRNLNWTWDRGEVIEQIGAVNYKVRVGEKCMMRHANQMKSVDSEAETSLDGEAKWMNVMLDTFEVETELDQQQLQEEEQQVHEEPDVVTAPRRSTRTRRPVVRWSPGH